MTNNRRRPERSEGPSQVLYNKKTSRFLRRNRDIFICDKLRLKTRLSSLDYRFALIPNAGLGHAHAKAYKANAAKNACIFYG